MVSQIENFRALLHAANVSHMHNSLLKYALKESTEETPSVLAIILFFEP